MIGELITELRKDLRLKQKDVAVHIGVSTGTVSNYECGRYEPDLETVRRLSKAIQKRRVTICSNFQSPNMLHAD